MPESMRAFWTLHAAPRIRLGQVESSSHETALTCARYPQKSHITSAHLKFTGSRFSVPDRLHFGHGQRPATILSPFSPSCWLGVVIFSGNLLRSKGRSLSSPKVASP